MALVALATAPALPAQPPEDPPEQAPAAEPGGIDFNQLRQLIEQSKARPAETPAQQMIAVIRGLAFDRSTAGILATRLEEARIKQAPAAPAGEPAPEMEAFKKDAEAFRRDVVLGRWDNVREFLGKLPQEVAIPAFETVLTKLAGASQGGAQPQPPPQPGNPQPGGPQQIQSPFLPPAEVLSLAAAAVTPPPKEQIKLLAKFLPHDPRPPREFFDGLRGGIRHFGGDALADRLRAAELLLEAGFPAEAGEFLPAPAAAQAAHDYAAMNLLARHRVALFEKDPKAAGDTALPVAWELSTAFLSDTKAPPEARGEALLRALELIPRLGDDSGQMWLKKTFSDPQGEGLELLATLGTLTARNSNNPSEVERLSHMKLQHAAVETLLTTEGVDAAAWAGVFTQFARQWNQEADVTRSKDQSDSRGMVTRFDEWGNMFYTRADTGFQGPGTRPIGAGVLLECAPDERWLATIETSTRNETLLAKARLLLKVKEENLALPIIGTLAATDADAAKSLVRETIKVWAQNHNPNQADDYRSRYMYFYGFNNQSGSIPLTRSKQERNLVELAELVRGIRALNLGESFHQELADAFISCHSQAEVWRVEAIEAVFGATGALDSSTLATLVSRMRSNLAGLWADPKVQQALQTKRKDVEQQEQILRGYQAANEILTTALAANPPQAWRLEEQLAALAFEESNYRSSLAPDPQHAATKRAALDALAVAAMHYAQALPLDDPKQETSTVFETWFFAALGSPSLEALKSHHVAAPAEYPKIKAALDALPGAAAARHLKMFATTLNNRLANVPPDLKLRYLEGTAIIASQHEALKDAAEVLAYYRDLTNEIQLDAAIDGSPQVGSTAPFGLRVNLRHTREIERESGGFQKYLQNQTNSPYGYNYGRPPEDYRDKFEKASRAVLEEHFEVISLTFQSDKVASTTDPQPGWRITPYAYFLLLPKGPQVDKVPPLKIDLDFTDTSGYVVLPVASAEVPIDARAAAPRPFRDLKVTQTLDARSQKENHGSLFLEVKATAHGLVPPLAELIALPVAGLETGTIEDRALQVVELDAAAEDFAPISEHEWRIELKPAGGVLPTAFHFPAVKSLVAAEDGLLRQHYVDVDLVPVGESLALGGRAPQQTPWWIAGAAGAVMVVGGVFLAKRKSHRSAPLVTKLPLPERLSPAP